ncbi:MAG: pyridoxal-phosphate dependent enzyme, partial [Planctomycetota bacterium]
GFDSDAPSFIEGFGWFSNSGVDNYMLNPGEGVFISLPSAAKLTFVGEVPQGALSTAIPTGFSIRASQVPQAGKVTTVQAKPTLADGLAVPTIGARSFDIARTRVDRVVTVSEEHLALAILRIVEGEKGVVEGAGAAPLAAFLSGQLSELRGKRVALLHCGGNIDPTVLGRAIGRGLVVDGRMTQFTAIIADRPGGLAELTAAVAAGGACVKQIEHERAFTSADISTVQVLCTVETRDAAHVEELHGLLQGRGIRVIARTQPGACPMPKYT